MEPKHAKAARALLGWSQAEFARQSNVRQATIADFETGKSKPHPNNRAAMLSALFKAGVVDEAEAFLHFLDYEERAAQSGKR